MLKAILLRSKIDRKNAELEALRAKDQEFATREAELEQAIREAEAPEVTDEERAEIDNQVNAFEEQRTAHETARKTLEDEIAALTAELEAEERKVPNINNAEKRERKENKMQNNINIRALPKNQRAFEAVYRTYEERAAIVEQNDVKEFLTQIRSLSMAKRSITGAELTVPVTMLDIIAENMFRYSKLLNRVRVRDVRGEARQTVAGLVPEAVWEGCCDALNELNFAFSQVEITCNKVGGYVLLCNSILAESDIDLAGTLVEMISESIGYAMDKAILYGKGQAYKMPVGIATRLAQQSKPDSYPVDAPEWVDLHTSNILTIEANLSGAEFWAALTVAAGKAFSRYARGTKFWAMSSETYDLLKSKVITFTASGDVAANVFGVLPVINGDVEILEFIPYGDIIGGFGDLYLLGRHQDTTIGMDMAGFTLRVKDSTLFWGKARADGMPIIPKGFVAININGQAPTTSMQFAGNSANDASLEALTVGSLTLSPSFDGDVLAYTASAASSVSSVAVNAIAAQSDALVGITVTSGTTTKNVNNGGNAALATGANTIAITVRKGNATRVYTVVVTRAA